MIKCKDCKYWENLECIRHRAIGEPEDNSLGDPNPHYIQMKNEFGQVEWKRNCAWNPSIVNAKTDLNYFCAFGEKKYYRR